MSKLKLDKINFDESDFLVEVTKEKEKTPISSQSKIKVQKEAQEILLEAQKRVAESELILNRAKAEAQKILELAQKETQETKNKIKVASSIIFFASSFAFFCASRLIC